MKKMWSLSHLVVGNFTDLEFGLKIIWKSKTCSHACASKREKSIDFHVTFSWHFELYDQPKIVENYIDNTEQDFCHLLIDATSIFIKMSFARTTIHESQYFSRWPFKNTPQNMKSDVLNIHPWQYSSYTQPYQAYLLFSDWWFQLWKVHLTRALILFL